MSDLDAELTALSDEESRAMARALTAADDARKILAEDLPEFLAREVKRAFLASPSFADSCSDEIVAAIKADVRAAGAAAAQSVLADLGSDEPWLAGVEHLGDAAEPTSFEDNPTVWSVVTSVQSVTTKLLQGHGFPPPPGGFDVRYRQPAFFVGGRHMKSVAEHYWKALSEVSELRRRRDQLSAAARSDELARRWDAL